jgi:hypothetical protein
MTRTGPRSTPRPALSRRPVLLAAVGALAATVRGYRDNVIVYAEPTG